MKAVKLMLLSFLIAILFISAIPVAAAPPTESPAKGPPVFEKAVFIHYGQDFAPGKPSGTPGNGPPGGKDKEDELYSYSRVHWADGDIPVSYWINMASSPLDSITVEEGITASFDTWEGDEGSYIDFTCEGITALFTPGLNVEQPDLVNVVGWADLSAQYPSAIGITITWSIRGKKEIVDCDTVLNSASYFAWTQYDGDGVPNDTWLPGYDNDTYFDADLQNIMTHEAGHWLMLNDLYDDTETVKQQTMYGYALDGELKSRSLETGDVDGVRKIYTGATK
ncbi:hypothetical protein ACFLUE_02225 [Chloroflexota bacterium]